MTTSLDSSTLIKETTLRRADGRVFTLRLVSFRVGYDCGFRIERDGEVVDRGEARFMPTAPRKLAIALFYDGIVRDAAALRAAKKLLAASWTRVESAAA